MKVNSIFSIHGRCEYSVNKNVSLFLISPFKVYLGCTTNSLTMAHKATMDKLLPIFVISPLHKHPAFQQLQITWCSRYIMLFLIVLYVTYAVSCPYNFFPCLSFLHSEPNSNITFSMNLFLTSLNIFRYFLLFALVVFHSYMNYSLLITISTLCILGRQWTDLLSSHPKPLQKPT